MAPQDVDPDFDSIQDRFLEIYQREAWGGGSGSGARPGNNLSYMEFLARFISLNEVRSVVDLGCGDWQFSRFIDWSSVHYTGIDVVPSLTNHNLEQFGGENVVFRCIWDVRDVPAGDLLICKDVFQHLPNKTIQAYLSALKSKFKWLLITNDDYPEDNLNGDIAAGQWRAVRLDLPPFSEKCVSLLRWVVISETPTVRKRLVLVAGEGNGRSKEEAKFPTKPSSKEIPRRIYQTWKVRAPLPANYELWSQTVKNCNPDFEYVIWDDSDNREFIRQNYPWFLSKYDSYEIEINRVDAVRYFVLYHFGGFYLDLDVECFASLDRYITGHDVVFGRMGSDPDFPDSIPNAIMASRPRQEFWLFLFSHLMTGTTSGWVEAITGPRFLKSCVDLWNQAVPDRRARIEAVRQLLSPDLASTESTRKITILPPKEWYPVDWSDPVHQRLRREILDHGLLTPEEKHALFGRSTLVTYWTHSW